MIRATVPAIVTIENEVQNSDVMGNEIDAFLSKLSEGRCTPCEYAKAVTANGDADVIGIPGVHIEAKAVERLNIHEAMEQSVSDARDGEIPVVIHKRNRKPILVTMLFDDWIEIYKN